MKLATMLREKGISVHFSKAGNLFVNRKEQTKDETSAMCLDNFEMKKLKHKAYVDRQKASKKHKEKQAEEQAEEVA